MKSTPANPHLSADELEMISEDLLLTSEIERVEQFVLKAYGAKDAETKLARVRDAKVTASLLLDELNEIEERLTNHR